MKEYEKKTFDKEMEDSEKRHATSAVADSHGPKVLGKHTTVSGQEIVTLSKDTKVQQVKTSRALRR